MNAMVIGPDVSIVIATYDRPASLRETLLSCIQQTNDLGMAIEIVVVDNHVSQNAKVVVDQLAVGSPWPMRYASELTRNMSVLRNRCFSEAHAPLVAFIDDDEIAEPDWLDALVGALRANGAQVAVGPRKARFEGGAAPAYDPTGAQFTRDLHLPDGVLIDLTRPSGKPNYGLGTGNSLFDVAVCFGDGAPPMREAFGNAGGEDAELFVRLHRKGCTIVWAARAIVTETVGLHRTSIDYRLLRTRRETQHYVSIYLDGARHPMLAWAELMIKGVIQLLAGAAIAGASLEYLSKTRIRGRLLMAHGLAKLAWKKPVGYIYQSTPESGKLA